jgi:hypothetical protein
LEKEYIHLERMNADYVSQRYQVAVIMTIVSLIHDKQFSTPTA